MEIDNTFNTINMFVLHLMTYGKCYLVIVIQIKYLVDKTFSIYTNT